jgi:hypothetical protein
VSQEKTRLSCSLGQRMEIFSLQTTVPPFFFFNLAALVRLQKRKKVSQEKTRLPCSLGQRMEIFSLQTTVPICLNIIQNTVPNCLYPFPENSQGGDKK